MKPAMQVVIHMGENSDEGHARMVTVDLLIAKMDSPPMMRDVKMKICV